MERAATRIVNWVATRYKINRRIVIVAGPGNNGGDALAVARLLSGRNYSVDCYLAFGKGTLSADCELNLSRLKEQGLARLVSVLSVSDFPSLNEGDVVIDGLFGSGLTRPVEGLNSKLIQHLNASGHSGEGAGNHEHINKTEKVTVLSIDIPSGLFGEDNTHNDLDSIIRADCTLTFQFPFLSFFFSENRKFTGNWEVLDIGLHPEIIKSKSAVYSMVARQAVSSLLPERERFAHKGTYGHALIISGSYGMMGASVLAGRGALRSGAGLVTTHVPRSGYQIMQSSVPELIVSTDVDEKCFSALPDISGYSAIAAGPGIGCSASSAKGLKALLEKVQVPLVLDADALNLIARDPLLLKLLPKGAVLTPHPGEFDRLAGKSPNGWCRHKRQIEFSTAHHVVVVLKGAYTGISFPDGTYRFNSTGNPGMATGGSGDVLTGIIVSLLAQGFPPEQASTVAVYLHGMAGDIAAEAGSQESVIAGDIIEHLGIAFKRIQTKSFLH